ncbi:MAG: energy-coupling factor transporter ATPase [Lachnospiraceae bacterium]|nr:energy-coupling factor transporter ATPase [Lachnospiraceae bacterium]
MLFAKTKKLTFDYIERNENEEIEKITTALNEVDIDIEEGEFIAILGKNGSGKSTLARHLNALLQPTQGSVLINGKDTKDQNKILAIRKEVSMVFQNPDNQIVGVTVEEDVAFGLENLAVESKKIREKVDKALFNMQLSEYAQTAPNRLSGGQKQRVALAGVLAMNTKCIVLDEPTAMLDPNGRQEVMEAISYLNQKKNITIILITHNIEEAMRADKIHVMKEGKIVLSGTPNMILSKSELMEEMGLALPYAVRFAKMFQIKAPNLDENDLIQYFIREKNKNPILSQLNALEGKEKLKDSKNESKVTDPSKGLYFDKVSFSYQPGTGFEKKAVKNISLSILPGEKIALIGQSGSGKSTLFQLMNGLLKTQEGTIYYNGEDISAKNYPIKELRCNIGLTFQYPEKQFFMDTVYDEVAFGPKNLGISKIEAQKRAYDAIEIMGLPSDLYDISPLHLSGGQKRSVAIASILAMKPEILLLDEPTAGLDAAAKKQLFEKLDMIHKKWKKTIIISSHNMDDIANFADKVIVMKQGELMYFGDTKSFFGNIDFVKECGLKSTFCVELNHRLQEYGMKLPKGIVSMNDLQKWKDEL